MDRSQEVVMKVLIACEFSGVVRDMFTEFGHFAVSCDFEKCETEGEHFIGDARAYLDLGWDLLIAHPPCTYLSNSGVRHLHSVKSRHGNLPKVHGEKRVQAMIEAARLFRDFLDAPVPRIAIENPVPSGYATTLIGRTYDQLIQPWQFGHGEKKATCLWLKNLPLLAPTHEVEGREARMHLMPGGKDQAKNRSRTYPGIARAMCLQWGGLEYL